MFTQWTLWITIVCISSIFLSSWRFLFWQLLCFLGIQNYRLNRNGWTNCHTKYPHLQVSLSALERTWKKTCNATNTQRSRKQFVMEVININKLNSPILASYCFVSQVAVFQNKNTSLFVVLLQPSFLFTLLCAKLTTSLNFSVNPFISVTPGKPCRVLVDLA